MIRGSYYWLTVCVLSMLGGAVQADSFKGWENSKRSPKKILSLFSAEVGPVSKLFMVHRKKGRFLIDVVYSKSSTPRMTGVFWSPDGKEVGVVWRVGKTKLRRKYPTDRWQEIRPLDRNPERYLLLLDMVKQAAQWGWPKTKLATLEPLKASLKPLPAGSLEWFVALARFFQKGGYLARHIVKVYARTHRNASLKFDPARKEADLVGYLTTILLVRFDGVMVPHKKLQNKLRNSFSDRAILFFRKDRTLRGGTTLTVSAGKRNRWEARKLVELIKANPGWLKRKNSGPLTVRYKKDTRIPISEIHIVLGSN